MARDVGRLGCAAESRARGESMVGTASRVRRWLLIEQWGSWGRNALLESQIDRDLAQAIDASARAHDVRVVLVRRPGGGRGGPHRVFLARSDRVHRWIEQLSLEELSPLRDLDLAVLGSDEPPGIGEPGPANLHLVCTNGKHDPCCADFGRPVVRSLHAAGIDAWESSHVGGDRFAANVVCLPTGVYFGRVEPQEAPRILRDHAAGIIDLETYRGRSCYPPLMQAAEIFARRELAERRLDALQFRSAVVEANEAEVVLSHVDGREVRVRVVRERADAEPLTCEDQTASPPWRQRLVSIEILAGYT